MFHGSLDQGSISPTFYDQLLHVQIPKGQKDSQVISVILGTLVGSARVKTAHKMLVKLTPGVIFINILEAAFVPVD